MNNNKNKLPNSERSARLTNWSPDVVRGVLSDVPMIDYAVAMTNQTGYMTDSDMFKEQQPQPAPAPVEAEPAQFSYAATREDTLAEVISLREAREARDAQLATQLGEQQPHDQTAVRDARAEVERALSEKTFFEDNYNAQEAA